MKINQLLFSFISIYSLVLITVKNASPSVVDLFGYTPAEFQNLYLLDAKNPVRLENLLNQLKYDAATAYFELNALQEEGSFQLEILTEKYDDKWKIISKKTR